MRADCDQGSLRQLACVMQRLLFLARHARQPRLRIATVRAPVAPLVCVRLRHADRLLAPTCMRSGNFSEAFFRRNVRFASRVEQRLCSHTKALTWAFRLGAPRVWPVDSLKMFCLDGG